jgi:hypothetical protein
MIATPAYVAEQLARQYTRDRIRDTEARRAARAARTAARERRDADPTVAPSATGRRWRVSSARTTTA